MQFISNGPEVPEALLQAHEEGKVVFFCGAGISYPAGLPGFEGLVKKIYQMAGTQREGLEKSAFGQKRYDIVLDLLEKRYPGGRQAIRNFIADALQPNFELEGATDTQAALLQLARSREGILRLVTTNFDRIFHEASNRTSQAFVEHVAPYLPIPKKSRWDGLVFLHGLLSENPNSATLDRLVATSGDFGLAYLTERWASRFVSELFRNFVVCFVGYSLEDPVLRYMMDAFAADRSQDEYSPEAYAFGFYMDGEKDRQNTEWRAKGVTPILYKVPHDNDHSALHRTLHQWSEIYRDGVKGKEAIVTEFAHIAPQDSTKQDDFVGRMLWALSDKTGLPAKRFAETKPVPPLEWLFEVFSKECFQRKDLPRFGVPVFADKKREYPFSLIRRPTSYLNSPPMLLASAGIHGCQWDPVMNHLASWLLHHLHDPRLILWLADRGGQLHGSLYQMIERQFKKIASSERAPDASWCESSAPIEIDTYVRTLWDFLLSGRVKSTSGGQDLYGWKRRLERDGHTTSIRLELRDLLAPKIVLYKPYHSDLEEASAPEARRPDHEVGWRIALTADHVRSTLGEFSDASWKDALPHLLDDLQLLLRDALDMQQELGLDVQNFDPAHFELPSISPHSQNDDHCDWVILIELLRDAWLSICMTNRARAQRLAQDWYQMPYVTFKRLALFAASQEDCISAEEWVGWLISDDAKLLWLPDTRREVCRLLALQGSRLARKDQLSLEDVVLAGPPRSMYPQDIEAQSWQRFSDGEIWLRLSKLQVSGAVLGEAASKRLSQISKEQPHKRLHPRQQEGFTSWTMSPDDPEFEDNSVVNNAPTDRTELAEWLKMPIPKASFFGEYRDNWQEVCRERFEDSIFALGLIATEGFCPKERWQQALQVWSEDEMLVRSWREVSLLVVEMPDDVLQEIVYTVSWWLQAASKQLEEFQGSLVLLCERIMNLQLEEDCGLRIDGHQLGHPVNEALNHPMGHVAHSLIHQWFKFEPSDDDGLPAELRPIFTEICQKKDRSFRHARVILASRLSAFFRVDRSWTDAYLLPLFDWKESNEASSVWEGFLWAPRLHWPLMEAMKSQFLDSAKHYSALGEHQKQYVRFLTYTALENSDTFSIAELQETFRTLPKEGLEASAQALYQSIRGAGEQCEEYYKHRIYPFWQNIWPKSRKRITGAISRSLCEVAIAARGEFPAALQLFNGWLQTIEHPNYVIHLLHESDLCGRFPVQVLALMDTMIDDQPWPRPKLKTCMERVIEAEPNLERDKRYQRLVQYLRLRGIE